MKNYQKGFVSIILVLVVVVVAVIVGIWYGVIPNFINLPSQSAAVANATASLKASYFNNINLSGKAVLEKQVSSVALTSSPASSVNKEMFSARYEGTLSVKASATYKFQIYVDDGIRIWIDGKNVLDKWTRQNGNYSFERYLATGNHPIKIEYFQQWGAVKLSVSWVPIVPALAGPAPTTNPKPTPVTDTGVISKALKNSSVCNHERYAYDGNGDWKKFTFSDKTVCHDLVYYSAKNLKLDLYLPNNGGNKDMPLIVWVHGGGFTSGGRFECAYNAQKFVSKGFAVACPSYRLSPDSKETQVPDQVSQTRANFPDTVRDIKTAVQYLRANAGSHYDADKIIIAGYSAGGYYAAFTALTNGNQKFAGFGSMSVSSDVQGAMIYAGITDFDTYTTKQSLKDQNYTLKMLMGSSVSKNYSTANPIKYVTKGSVPFLIIHGTSDTYVPVAVATNFDKAFANAGADHKLLTIKGATHQSIPSDSSAFNSAVSWLDSKFK